MTRVRELAIPHSHLDCGQNFNRERHMKQQERGGRLQYVKCAEAPAFLLLLTWSTVIGYRAGPSWFVQQNGVGVSKAVRRLEVLLLGW